MMKKILSFVLLLMFTLSLGHMAAAEESPFYIAETRATIYDNSSGSLEAAGVINRGTVFIEVKKLGANWHAVNIGGQERYIYTGATSITELRPEQVTGNPAGRVNLLEDVPVVDWISGDQVFLGELKKGALVEVHDQVEGYYEIIFSGRKGFIESELTESALKTDPEYFVVSGRDTPVYRQTSEGLVASAHLSAGQTFKRSRDYGSNWHEIDMGHWLGYVYKAATSASNPDLMPKPLRTDRTIGSLTVTRSAPVYDNSTGSLDQFATLHAGQNYQILRDFGSNWYEIAIGGRVGYINKATVSREFKSNDRYFQTGASGAVVYDNRSGSLKAVGRLLPNQIYHRTRDYGANWHEIQFADYKGYVYKGATFPTASSYQRSGSGSSLLTVEADQRLTVYETSSGSRKAVGSIDRGTRFKVTGISGNWYRMQFASRESYVYAPATSPVTAKVVQPKQIYSYNDMQRDINVLRAMYPSLVRVESIGTSVNGRSIPAVKLGNGSREIMFNGSFHAREHMTTNVMMNMIDEYARAYEQGRTLGKYQPELILDDVSIWFVPMVNPDGVTLVQNGPSGMPQASNLIRWNGGSSNFSRWKANARGVDLNRQYPAYWDSISNNPGRPSWQNYKGTKPLTEPEAKAMYDFMNRKNFRAIMSYHSSGEVLFARSRLNNGMWEMSNLMRDVTGYPILDLTNSTSGGGYSDWIAVSKGVPGITVEIAPFVGAQPVPLSYWDRVWQRNQYAGLAVAEYVRLK